MPAGARAPRDASAVFRRPRAWWLAIGFAAALLGCAHEAPTPTGDDLVAKLHILQTQQGFTAKQVRCVADHARAALHGADLRRFDDELDLLQSDGSAAGMSAASTKVFTDAISACTVAGG